MKKTLFIILVALAMSLSTHASQSFSAKGLLLKIDKERKSLVISCETIPGYMNAMVMPFSVRNMDEVQSLKPGALLEFTVVVDGDTSYIEKIRVHHYESVEQDPLAARRLKLMAAVSEGTSVPQKLATGAAAPDFELIDQLNRKTTLSQYSGKVVALTFTYTHCALPNFCFRIANNFRQLQKRFAPYLGRDLVFMTVTFDPAHDTPDVMAKYGKTWNANPQNWRLLTGEPSTVEDMCNRYGISFWPDEGLMIHSLHTFVIGRDGHIVADLEGNEYTAAQLGDLVETTLKSPAAHPRDPLTRAGKH